MVTAIVASDENNDAEEGRRRRRRRRVNRSDEEDEEDKEDKEDEASYTSQREGSASSLTPRPPSAYARAKVKAALTKWLPI